MRFDERVIMRNRVDIGASLFLVLLGLGVMIEAIRLGLGTTQALRPGFLPLFCGILVTFLSLLLLFNAWRGRTEKPQPFGQWRRPVAVLAGLAVYVIIFQRLGFVISTAFLSAVLLRVFDMKLKWPLLAASIGIAIGTFVLFKMLLGVELPYGIISFLGVY
jgi:putative tricarboxylic transport membrane protein